MSKQNRLAGVLGVLVLGGCVSYYDGLAKGVPSAEIEFLRNKEGTKNDTDPLQGYALIGKNKCDEGANLARFSFGFEFRKIQYVEADQPLALIIHSSAGMEFTTCYSYVRFTPQLGHRYTISHLGHPYAENCVPYIVDKATGAPPTDLEVETKLQCNW